MHDMLFVFASISPMQVFPADRVWAVWYSRMRVFFVSGSVPQYHLAVLLPGSVQ